MSKSPIVIQMNEFNPSAIRYMQPRANERGGKSVTVLSTQSNRGLYLTMPLLMSWGIADYLDEKTGESDGKYTISLQFPRAGDNTPESDMALEKLKKFENQILEDAVKNSEVWFGKKQSREIVEFSYFPFLKYRKNKDTKEVDYSSPPSMRPKVPCYEGVWKVEIFDPNEKLLFPCDVPGTTPMDFISKGSHVACVIQCGGLWVTGKGWGLIWKLVQSVVKPQTMDVVFGSGRCHLTLSPTEKTAIVKDVVKEEVKPVVQNTHVDNSDDEEELASVKVEEKIEEKVEEEVEEEEEQPVVKPVKKVVKKVVKK